MIGRGGLWAIGSGGGSWRGRFSGSGGICRVQSNGWKMGFGLGGGGVKGEADVLALGIYCLLSVDKLAEAVQHTALPEHLTTEDKRE